MVSLQCEALVGSGHGITRFAAPGSRSSARVCPLLETAHPDLIGSALHESDHVACAWDEIDTASERGRGFDVVHDHSGFTALAMARPRRAAGAPVVQTLHGPFVAESAGFFVRHDHKRRLSRSASRRPRAPPPV